MLPAVVAGEGAHTYTSSSSATTFRLGEEKVK